MDWFSDTSANQHVTLDLANPTGCEPYLGNNNLHVNDSNGLSIFNIRHTMLHTTKHIFTLSNVLQVPHIIKPLFFIQKFYLTIMCFLNFICFFMLRILPPRQCSFLFWVWMVSMFSPSLLPCQFLKFIGLLTYLPLLIIIIVNWVILIPMFLIF